MSSSQPDLLQSYMYRGARALVILHEQEMHQFVVIWKKARDLGVVMPESPDGDMMDYDSLLHHVLGAAREYMVWICEMLELPDPGIEPIPAMGLTDSQGTDYLNHLLDRWRYPLAGITEEQCYFPDYTSRWDVKFCIDAMLEHAVMHPVRHRFHLEGLMTDKVKSN